MTRMAVLYDLAQRGHSPTPARNRPPPGGGVMAPRLVQRPGAPADAPDPRRAASTPAPGSTGHRPPSRGGRIAAIGADLDAAGPRSSTPTADRAAGVRRPARAPAHARAGKKEDLATRHRRRRRRRLLRRARDAEHRPGARLRRPLLEALFERGAPRGPRAASASCRRSRAGWRARELTEMRDAGRARRRRLHRRRPAGRARRAAAARVPVRPPARRAARPARARTSRFARRPHARGHGLGGARHRRLSRRSPSRPMVARDLALARYEDGRVHLQHLSTRGSLEELAWARGRGRPRLRRGLAAPPAAHATRPCARSTPTPR